MKKPLNRMAKVEDRTAPKTVVQQQRGRIPSHCPHCGNVSTAVVSERIQNNRRAIGRRCDKCQAQWTEAK